jgi:hypothetical protein
MNERINENINGIACFDKQVIRLKCLDVKKTIEEERKKKFNVAREKQKEKAKSIREEYYKSWWYKTKLKIGLTKDVNDLNDVNVIHFYCEEIYCIANMRLYFSLIELILADTDAINYKNDLMNLCDELILTCDALKGDEIWLSSNTLTKLNEKI